MLVLGWCMEFYFQTRPCQGFKDQGDPSPVQEWDASLLAHTAPWWFTGGARMKNRCSFTFAHYWGVHSRLQSPRDYASTGRGVTPTAAYPPVPGGLYHQPEPPRSWLMSISIATHTASTREYAPQQGTVIVQVKGILWTSEQVWAPIPMVVSEVVPPCTTSQDACGADEGTRDRQMVGKTPQVAGDSRATLVTPEVILPTPFLMAPHTAHQNLFPLVLSSARSHSPIMIQTSPSYDLSFHCFGPASPPFTELSTPTLPIVMSTLLPLMNSTILPPVISPRSDKDPVFAHWSPLLQESPPLTRALLDEYALTTSSGTLPPASDVPPAPSAAPTLHYHVPLQTGRPWFPDSRT